MAATVRALYDDNITTSPDGSKEGSFGISVSPSVHLNLPLDQTFISLGYVYSLIWYENREPNHNDQSHEFNGKLTHRFGPQHDISVFDSFVFSSEPTVVDQGGIITSPLKSDSSVIHNQGGIDYNVGVSRQMSLGFGYGNNFYDYEEEGAGSRSALLDRIEQLFRVDLRNTFTPNLVGLVGYTFGLNAYTADELIAIGSPLKSDSRDSYNHYGYVGADYDLTARLRSSIRVGIQYADFHEVGETDLSPYLDAKVSYVYMTGSSVEVGVRHARNATDVVAVDAQGNPTLDAQTTAVWLQVVQQITPKFTGTAMVQYQNSTFFGGANDGSSEDLWLLGLNLEYRFNRNWSAEAGYNFDVLDSEAGSTRQYNRNRVYVGLRATY